MTHKTPEEAAKAVLTGDLGPLNLTFSEFRYRMTTEWPQEPLSDQFLFDLYHDLTDRPEETPTFSKLKALLEDSGMPFVQIPLDTETTQPEDLFGPMVEDFDRCGTCGRVSHATDEHDDFMNAPGVGQWPREEPKEHDVLAAIEALDTKVDKMQTLQERIYRMEMAKQAQGRKNKRNRAIAKVRNKFRRKGR